MRIRTYSSSYDIFKLCHGMTKFVTFCFVLRNGKIQNPFSTFASFLCECDMVHVIGETIYERKLGMCTKDHG